MKLRTENHPLLKVFTNKKLLLINETTYKQIDNVKFNPMEDSDCDVVRYSNLIDSIFSKIPNRNYYVYLSNHKGMIYDFQKTDDGIKIVMWYLDNDYDTIRYFYEYSFKDKKGVSYFKEGLVEGLNDRTRIGLDIFCEKYFSQTFEMFCLDNIHEFLMRTIIFVELSKDRVILKDLKPKDKFGDILKGNLIKNETNRNITIVNSLWNVISISVGEFKVRGHFRLQKCGVGLSEVKLVFIDEFIKTKYVRRSTRELTFG